MARREVTVRLRTREEFRAGFNKYNSELNRTDKNIRKAGRSTEKLGGAMRGATTAISGFVAAFAVHQVVSFIGEMTNLGLMASQTQQRFDILNASIGGTQKTMEGLREATLGLASDLDLQMGANMLMTMGLANSPQELEDILSMITRLKKPTDSLSEAIENFSLMLANQSVLRLDSFGISSGKVRDRIKELLASGEALNREEAFKLAVLEQGTVTIDRLGASATNAATGVATLGTRLQNLKEDLAQDIGQTVSSVLDTVMVGIEGNAQVNTAAAKLGETIGLAIADAMEKVLTGGDKRATTISEALYDGAQQIVTGAIFSRMSPHSAADFIDKYLKAAVEIAASNPDLKAAGAEFQEKVFGTMLGLDGEGARRAFDHARGSGLMQVLASLGEDAIATARELTNESKQAAEDLQELRAGLERSALEQEARQRSKGNLQLPGALGTMANLHLQFSDLISGETRRGLFLIMREQIEKYGEAATEAEKSSISLKAQGIDELVQALPPLQKAFFFLSAGLGTGADAMALWTLMLKKAGDEADNTAKKVLTAEEAFKPGVRYGAAALLDSQDERNRASGNQPRSSRARRGRELGDIIEENIKKQREAEKAARSYRAEVEKPLTLPTLFNLEMKQGGALESELGGILLGGMRTGLDREIRDAVEEMQARMDEAREEMSEQSDDARDKLSGMRQGVRRRRLEHQTDKELEEMQGKLDAAQEEMEDRIEKLREERDTLLRETDRGIRLSTGQTTLGHEMVRELFEDIGEEIDNPRQAVELNRKISEVFAAANESGLDLNSASSLGLITSWQDALVRGGPGGLMQEVMNFNLDEWLAEVESDSSSIDLATARISESAKEWAYNSGLLTTDAGMLSTAYSGIEEAAAGIRSSAEGTRDALEDLANSSHVINLEYNVEVTGADVTPLIREAVKNNGGIVPGTPEDDI